MFLIPLNQIESVDLVIHALRAAAGEADCSMCPARRVCTRQCLSIADSIQQMVATNSLPHTDPEATPPQEPMPLKAAPRAAQEPEPKPDNEPDPDGSGGSHLRIIK
ncbi:MAG: hypothetical protein OET90_00180 [Desulfuromonadales bacterium]|nr:hypothetical protein [Desulfuromonadales bacterium]